MSFCEWTVEGKGELKVAIDVYPYVIGEQYDSTDEGFSGDRLAKKGGNTVIYRPCEFYSRGFLYL